jgi:alpha-tubulin suppressor-like RCC1 family protein
MNNDGRIYKLARISMGACGLLLAAGSALWGQQLVGTGDNGDGQLTPPPGLTGVVSISTGSEFSIALKGDGTVVGWGADGGGQTDPPSGLTGVVAISAGWSHSLALKSDGTVVAWGYDGNHETEVPPGLSGVISIVAGEYVSVALKSDGTVVAWGLSVASPPAGLSGVVAIAGNGWHVLALKSDGTVVAWGLDELNVPVTSPTGLSHIVAIAAGGEEDALLRSDGTVVVWSYEYHNGTVQPGFTGIIAIAMGFNVVGLRSDGTVVGAVVASGVGNVISLGLTPAGGNFSWVVEAPNSPIAQWGTTFPNFAYGPLKQLASGSKDNLALTPMGTVVGWGPNSTGQTTGVQFLSNIKSISSGSYHSLAVAADGTMTAWGDSSYGKTTVPGAIQGLVTQTAGGLNHTLALTADGTVVAWGDNLYGQSTVPSAALSGVKAIAAGGNDSMALKDDGSIITWGQHAVSGPMRFGIAIAAGGSHFVALENDGTVIAWGDDTSNQTNVPAGLSNVAGIVAGGLHTLARRADGTVVAWGDDSSGEIDVPPGMAGVFAMSAGDDNSEVLFNPNLVSPSAIRNVVISADNTSTFTVEPGAGCPVGQWVTTASFVFWPATGCSVTLPTQIATARSDTNLLLSGVTGPHGTLGASPTLLITTPGVYSASFDLFQYRLTTQLSPAGAGAITGGGWYTAGQAAAVTAQAAAGYVFGSWNTGATTPTMQTIMNQPASITATFLKQESLFLEPVPQFLSNSAVTFQAMVGSRGDVIGNGVLNFVLNGTSIGSVTVNGIGLYSLSQTVTLPPGTYNLTATLQLLDRGYAPTTATTTVTVASPTRQ